MTSWYDPGPPPKRLGIPETQNRLTFGEFALIAVVIPVCFIAAYFLLNALLQVIAGVFA